MSCDTRLGVSTRRTINTLERGKGRTQGSAGALVKALAVLGHEIFPPPRSPRQHVSTLRAMVRKHEPTWSTPPFVIAAVLTSLRIERFCLDVASPTPPCVPCAAHFDELTDGLKQAWTAHTVWCNPPYDAIPAWTDKLLSEINAGRAQRGVALLPFAVTTRAFERVVDSGAGLISIAGRLRFGEREHSAPFPSAVCTWGVSRNEIDAIAAALGKTRIWSYGHAVNG